MTTRTIQITKLFSIREVASMIGVDYPAFYWQITKGHVPAPTRTRGQRRLYYSEADVQGIIDSVSTGKGI